MQDFSFANADHGQLASDAGSDHGQGHVLRLSGVLRQVNGLQRGGPKVLGRNQTFGWCNSLVQLHHLATHWGIMSPCRQPHCQLHELPFSGHPCNSQGPSLDVPRLSRRGPTVGRNLESPPPMLRTLLSLFQTPEALLDLRAW